MEKMKKRFLLPSIAAAAMLFLAACGAGDATTTGAGPGEAPAPGQGTAQIAEFTPEASGLDENLRFIEPRTISVALWDRANERVPVFAESYWATWVQDAILAEHNIIVEWVTVPRWSEEEIQSTMLAGAMAPDVGLTFSDGMVRSFGQMGGLLNLYPLLQTYRDVLPNLYSLVGEEMIYWELDPVTNELFAITGRLFQDGRSLTFIREDWLNTLNLPIPTTLEEFEYTLTAFRDNANILPGSENGPIVPYFLGHDITWHAGTLFESLIPSDVTEREWFVHSFPGNNNERLFHFEDVIREGSRILNRWFHNDLLWRDFAVSEEQIGWDFVVLGRVGSFTINWDFPFRAAEGLISGMREHVGPDANLIPIMPFVNDAGQVRTFFPQQTDRSIFFPVTNTEPLASLLYLDFMSRPEVLDLLQFGIEGVHHEVLPNGAISSLAETADNPWPDHQFIPSLRNFDIALTVNGIHFSESDPDRAVATLALGYPGIDPDAIVEARNMGLRYAYWFRNVITRPIASEEGMTVPLIDARDTLLHTVVAGTSPEDFDSVFTAMYQNYLSLGAAAVIAEREQAWLETFGDVDTMP
ncbi:MAG: hypothetical protein FWG63_02615 [Defluviitaleaceae bacterium]|nr:hypothetical protein [Defluviitaleaceae bacterium]